MQVTTIGLDIAKNVFQVHGIDAAEKVVVRKQLRRRQVLEFFHFRSVPLGDIAAQLLDHLVGACVSLFDVMDGARSRQRSAIG